MITKPSSARIVEVVRHELRTSISDAVGECPARTVLAMLDTLLHGVAARCEHEAAWMIEEIAAIEALAQEALDTGVDANGSIAAACVALRDNRHRSYRVSDIQAEYEFASRLLSNVIEASLRHGGTLRERAESVLRARVDREIDILGPLSLVGRT